MIVQLAQKGGFCFGVRRALDAAQQEAGRNPRGLFTFGPIIHNPQVVEQLEGQGVMVCEQPEAMPAGATVVIRSHGIGPQYYERFARRQLHVVDATCPFVRRIQLKAESCADAGVPVIIVGEAQHPEVVGIVGWSKGQAYVIHSLEEVDRLPHLESACLMAQTTTALPLWEELKTAVEARIPQLEIFHSICHATQQRQTEAAQMARACDTMIVIGGRNSSNTAKLAQLCRQHCSRVLQVQTARELPEAEYFYNSEKVGIVSGASTPDWIIKEVFITMSEIDKKDLNQDQAEAVVATEAVEANQASQSAAPIEEEKAATIPSAGNENGEVNFAEDFEKMMVTIRPGQVITGKVVSVNENEVCVNIGYKSDGFISRSEFSANEDVNPVDVVKEGDDIEVEVLKVNDGEGNVLLSKKNVDSRKHWKEVMEQFTEGGHITAVGKQAVKGGLIANANGIRAFIPASQLDTKYVEDIEAYVGKTMELKIMEVEKHRKRFVASRKAVLLEEEERIRNEKWDQLHEGDKVTGIVRRLTDFGAFVDIGGIDGLVHVTNLAWGRVQHPKDVVSIGQTLECVILKVDKENQRVSLGHKQLMPKPWDVASQKYIPGTVVTGKVVRIVSFGAFVELEPGLDGLVHISQIADKRIDKVENVLQPGQVVNVKILDVNPAEHRISLSIRDAQTEKSENDYSLDDYESADYDEDDNGDIFEGVDEDLNV